MDIVAPRRVEMRAGVNVMGRRTVRDRRLDPPAHIGINRQATGMRAGSGTNARPPRHL